MNIKPDNIIINTWDARDPNVLNVFCFTLTSFLVAEILLSELGYNFCHYSLTCLKFASRRWSVAEAESATSFHCLLRVSCVILRRQVGHGGSGFRPPFIARASYSLNFEVQYHGIYLRYQLGKNCVIKCPLYIILLASEFLIYHDSFFILFSSKFGLSMYWT